MRTNTPPPWGISPLRRHADPHDPCLGHPDNTANISARSWPAPSGRARHERVSMTQEVYMACSRQVGTRPVSKNDV
jgi:hypothetical protein